MASEYFKSHHPKSKEKKDKDKEKEKKLAEQLTSAKNVIQKRISKGIAYHVVADWINGLPIPMINKLELKKETLDLFKIQLRK